jgi:hypothetical protein
MVPTPEPTSDTAMPISIESHIARYISASVKQVAAAVQLLESLGVETSVQTCRAASTAA